MTLVVGLVGGIASGKGVVSRYLQDEYGAHAYTFSDILKDVLVRLHLRVDRGNLQTLGKEIRRDFGADTLVNAMREDIARDEADIVVVDGIRFQNEVDMIKCFSDRLLLAIDAPLEVRYQRACKRGTRGEASLSLEEFKALHEAETERHIEDAAQRADHTLQNTGSKDELTQKVKELINARLH